MYVFHAKTSSLNKTTNYKFKTWMLAFLLFYKSVSLQTFRLTEL